MASTNKTANYELSQYIGGDKPTYLGDYNSDMLKIDTQMKANATAIGSISSDVTIAINTANTASSTATSASETANNASTTASNAQTTANSASATASSALSTATSAQTKANEIGTLSNLNTEDKTSIVSAINELKSNEAYSTNEIKTNKIWIDDKPIYRKVFSVTSPSNNSWKLLDSNNYEFIVNINGEMTSTENYINVTKYINFYRLNGSIYFQAGSTFSQNKQCTFYIEYTKTTD